MTPPPSTKASGIAALSNLLTPAHPASAVPDLISSKLQYRPLALLPTSTARDARRAARPTAKRRHPQPLTARERRSLKLNRIAPDTTYETVLPLVALWQSYARSLVSGAGLAQRIASGDIHGAVVEVVRCRCVDRVGIRGVVVMETRGALVVVREGAGGVRTLPKEGTVFAVEIDREEGKAGKVRVEIHGDSFGFRSAERAGRKFKSKAMLDL